MYEKTTIYYFYQCQFYIYIYIYIYIYRYRYIDRSIYIVMVLHWHTKLKIYNHQTPKYSKVSGNEKKTSITKYSKKKNI